MDIHTLSSNKDSCIETDIDLLTILFVNSVIFDYQGNELRNEPTICNMLPRSDMSISV
jgi:hypothetical protein